MSQRRKVKISELLNKQNGKIILSCLQAGRIKDGKIDKPYRLTDDDLELLKDEYIEF